MQKNNLKFKILQILHKYFSPFTFRFKFNQGQAPTPFILWRFVAFLKRYAYVKCLMLFVVVGFYLKPLQRQHERCRGQAALITVIFIIGAMAVGSLSFSALALKQTEITRINIEGKKSFFLAEASQEDVVYRSKTGRSLSTEEVLVLDGYIATSTISDDGNNREIISIGEVNRSQRKIEINLSTSETVNFNYGVQIGDGGVELLNSSLITGNLISSGSIVGTGNVVNGTIISTGSNGLIDDMRATEDGYAHTINDSFIERDAYYQVITDTTVLGIEYPGSPDISSGELPIPDSLVETWKSAAEAGGIINSPCPYKIDGSETQTIGPVKITCDFEIKNKATLSLLGPVWVVGNIDINNSALIKVDQSIGGESLAIIADNPADRLTSSKIKLTNSSTYEGSGSPGSFLLLLSQNNSAEQGGSEKAIEIQNNTDGDLLVYAGHGLIEIKNNVDLKEITSFKLRLLNFAEVTYDSGLSNTRFSSGPGGGYNIQDWREIE